MERILRSLLALAEATLRILRAAVHLLLLLPRLVPLVLHVPTPRFQLTHAVPRAFQLGPRLRFHSLRRLRGVVPVIDLLHELLHLGGAFISCGGEELLGLAGLLPGVVGVPLGILELVDGAVEFGLHPFAIAVARFEGTEAVVGRLERLLRDGELRSGVIALLDDGVDVLSTAFAVARANEEPASCLCGSGAHARSAQGIRGDAERAERQALVARDEAPAADGAREAADGVDTGTRDVRSGSCVGSTVRGLGARGKGRTGAR